MIATLFIIFAFIRAFPWSRRRAYAAARERTQLALTLNTSAQADEGDHQQQRQQQQHHQQGREEEPCINNNDRARPSISRMGNGHGNEQPSSRPRRKSSKFHEVTFSGSVGGGDSDGETAAEAARGAALSVTMGGSQAGKRHSLSATSTSNSGSIISAPYRTLSGSGAGGSGSGSGSFSSGGTTRSRGSRDYGQHEYYQLHASVSPSTSTNNGRIALTQRSDTMATEAEEFEDEERPPLDDDEDESYDRETEEFYSNIQDAAGTSSHRKRSSLFSRSDSSATTTSSSGGGTFTGGGKRRSAASIMSSSMGSDMMLGGSDRRSSTATEYSVRSTAGSVPINTQRRSSGRIRRYVSRMTIAGARRRTTGR